MKQLRRWMLVGLTALLFNLDAAAQQEVLMTGEDYTGTQHRVRTDGVGVLQTTTVVPHGACTHTAVTVGTVATNCPATARTGRASITVQLRTAGATLMLRSDGQAATTTVGLGIQTFETYQDNLASTAPLSCVCSVAGCDVQVVECL